MFEHVGFSTFHPSPPRNKGSATHKKSHGLASPRTPSQHPSAPPRPSSGSEAPSAPGRLRRLRHLRRPRAPWRPAGLRQVARKRWLLASAAWIGGEAGNEYWKILKRTWLNDAEWQMKKPFKKESCWLRFKLKGAFQRFRLQRQALYALEPARMASDLLDKHIKTAQVHGFNFP